MAHEKRLIRYQLHVRPEPLSKEEVAVCGRLQAHVAAVNLINEISISDRFDSLQILLQSLNGLLAENGTPAFGNRLEEGHIHVYALQRPLPEPDVAVISYFPEL